MNYSNIYPMDTVYPTTSLAFPEDTSVPSYQIPTVSSEIDYSENGGTVDPPNETEIENKKENENMLKALRLFSIEYTKKQLNNAREMKERLIDNNTTLSDDAPIPKESVSATTWTFGGP